MPRRRVEVTLSELEESDIKERLWNGEVIADVAQAFKVPRSTVASIKRGDRAYYVLWPNGDRGSMPPERAALICDVRGGKGFSKDMQEKLSVVSLLDKVRGEESPGDKFDLLEAKVNDSLRLLRDSKGLDVEFSRDLSKLCQVHSNIVTGELEVTYKEYRLLVDKISDEVGVMLDEE